MIKHVVQIENGRMIIQANDDQHRSHLRVIIPLQNPQIVQTMLRDLLDRAYTSGQAAMRRQPDRSVKVA